MLHLSKDERTQEVQFYVETRSIVWQKNVVYYFVTHLVGGKSHCRGGDTHMFLSVSNSKHHSMGGDTSIPCGKWCFTGRYFCKMGHRFDPSGTISAWGALLYIICNWAKIRILWAPVHSSKTAFGGAVYARWAPFPPMKLHSLLRDHLVGANLHCRAAIIKHLCDQWAVTF